MKVLGVALAASIIGIISFGFTKIDSHVTQYSFNTEESEMIWTGKKATGQHVGTIKMKEGYLALNHGSFSGGKIVIDMKSIANTDIKNDAGKAKLEKHLKGADFFEVEKYPEATFLFKRLERDAAGKPGAFKATGSLTMKGKTNDVSFPVTLVMDHSKIVARGNLTFDRTKWDIKYKSSLENSMINDEIELSFGVVAYAKGGH